MTNSYQAKKKLLKILKIPISLCLRNFNVSITLHSLYSLFYNQLQVFFVFLCYKKVILYNRLLKIYTIGYSNIWHIYLFFCSFKLPYFSYFLIFIFLHWLIFILSISSKILQVYFFTKNQKTSFFHYIISKLFYIIFLKTYDFDHK